MIIGGEDFERERWELRGNNDLTKLFRYFGTEPKMQHKFRSENSLKEGK